ncbi:MAG TPA: SusC/RagA family TonB-linked outer membrane protein, partial [Flavitalea sp.]|nr:SusC/RagA family TonB-linked outer membrane protein [Flavitalea sp.]
MTTLTPPLKVFPDPSIRLKSKHPEIKRLLLILRLSLFIVLALTELTANAKSQEQRISLTEKKVPLEKIFKLIESKTEYAFYYQNELLENVPPVSITIINALVEEILEILFKQVPLSYRIIDNNIVIKSKTDSKLPENVRGPVQLSGPVKGKVVDENGSPLEGVTVTVFGTSTAAKTDAEGNYLVNSGQADSVLVFSFVGYATKRVSIEGRETINLDLLPANGMLSDIVVVGYGTQKKSLVTGAISSIKASEFSKSSTTSIDQVLQGRVAGVSVSTNSGMPGEPMRVRIRGIGSNGNSDPLYIVDGIVVSSLNNLDPSEISSVEVLKDAASAAIYGAQGANGVVIVSTKTGKKGALSIDLNTQYGSSTLKNLPKMMNAFEYTSYLREAGIPNVQDPTTVGESTDWIDAIIKPAEFQRYTMNISGGSDKSTYLVGGSMTDQEGIIGGPNAQFRRYAFRVNSDHTIKPWLKIGERLSFTNTVQTSIPQENSGSVVGGAVMMDPLTPVVYAGVLPSNVQDAIANGYKPVQDDNGNYYGIGAFPNNEFSNPLAVTQINHNKNKNYIFSGNVYMDIEPLKGLKFTSRYGIELSSANIRNWAPSYWMGPYNFGNTASVFSGNNSRLHWQWENFASYQRSIGVHSFSLLAGTSAIKNSLVTMGTTGRGLLLEEDQ